MRIYNRYILALGISFAVATNLLGVWRVKDVTIYFSIYAIIYLAATTLFVYFNPRARRSLAAVTFVVFAGFMSIVILKVMEILRG